MRIISHWSDYYDNMRCFSNPAYCSDDFTYLRKTDDLEINLRLPFNYSVIECFDNPPFKYDISAELIGFCGLWYVLYKVLINGEELGNPTYEYYYDLQLAIHKAIDHKYLSKNFNNTVLSPYNQLRIYRGKTAAETLQKIVTSKRKYMDNVFKEALVILNKEDLFKRYNTPTININNQKRINGKTISVLSVNPRLSDLRFYKIIEGNIAYQEIEMFLGNELLPKDNPDQITDNKILITNHGFDIKTSFRNSSSKADKREKRRENKRLKRHE